LSNLDANLRDAMQKEIRSIVTQEKITAVYVTHDQKEALSMSDVVVVLSEGRVEQVGTPEEIYYRPATRFVAQFMGAPNMIEAVVAGVDAEHDHIIASCALGSIHVRRKPGDEVRAGDALTLVLKQEDFVLAGSGPPSANHYNLPVRRRIFLGDRTEILCAAHTASDQTISIYTSIRGLAHTATLSVHCRPEDIHYFRER
jgi:iron(III) transport system ATP-binding protein